MDGESEKMIESKNSEILTFTIDTIIKIIGKRTEPAVAYNTINKVINQILPNYNFLKYVKNIDLNYSEIENKIIVDQEINNIDYEVFKNCIKDLIDLSTREIGEKADFFFFRELRDNLQYNNEPIVKDILLNLNRRQHEYIINRKEDIRREKIFFNIKNSEIIEPLIKSLIYLLSKIDNKSNAEQTMISLIDKNMANFGFLNQIDIKNDISTGGLIQINVDNKIDSISSVAMAEALEKIIEDVGKLTKENFENSFINDLKIIIGENNTKKLNTIGIDFNRISNAIKYQNKRIVIKVLDSLIDVLSIKTSKNNAISMISETIVFFQGIHEVLNHIKINTSYPEGNDIYTVLPDINSIEAYKLGTAFRDVISMIQKNHKTIPLIREFKEKLGNDYLSEIEKLGVNLHFLELKYSNY